MSTRPAPRYAALRGALPKSGGRAPAQQGTQPPPAGQEPATTPAAPPLPDLRDPRFALERETLKLVLQNPAAVGHTAKDVDAGDFTHPTYRAVWEVIAGSGGPAVGATDPGWGTRLRDRTEDPAVSSALSALVR